MTYQITYFSRDGYCSQMAEALLAILPPGTVMRPMGTDTPADADAHLVGFDLRFSDQGKLPETVIRFLGKLREKTVFLFATTPYQPDDVQSGRIQRRAVAALPRECDYRGMFLCGAEPSQELLQGFRHAAEVKPNSDRIRHWLDRCLRAVGHPDEADRKELCQFAEHVLK